MSLIVIDTETTGVDKQRDQVIELCIQFGLEGSARTWRFRPSIPIPAVSTAIHGITDADVAECPTFAWCAPAIADYFAGATVIVGYNVDFDLGMLGSEFDRIGHPLDLSGKTIVDPLQLWRSKEPRGLRDAYAKFVGGTFDDAHSAEADVNATGKVLVAMLRAYGIEQDWEAVANICNPERATWVGPSNHLRWDGDRVVIGFGKYLGVALAEVDAGYLRWVAGKDFPPHVRDIVGSVLNGDGSWVERYRRAA